MKWVAATLPRPGGSPTSRSASVPGGVGMCSADPSGAVFPDVTVVLIAFDDAFDFAALSIIAFVIVFTPAD